MLSITIPEILTVPTKTELEPVSGAVDSDLVVLEEDRIRIYVLLGQLNDAMNQST